jgi:hypothetical protein
MRGVEGIGADRAQTFFPSGRGETMVPITWVGDVGETRESLTPLFLPRDSLERISNLAEQGSSIFKNRENPD